MKKSRFTAVIAAALAVVMMLFVGCGNNDDGDKKPSGNKDPLIMLRSDAQQELLVGGKITLMYSVYNTESEVMISSDNTDVVEVDRFATATAVGAGNATVTIALKDIPTVKVEVAFKVTRNNFMTDAGFYNGNIKFGEQATGGPVSLESGQVQLLANAHGQQWFFKTHIDHRGYVGADSAGFWGVGSFLVDAAHRIGDTMYWYMLRNTDINSAKAYYGGWRYDYTVTTHKETSITEELYDITGGVDFTIIRNGVTHYVIAEFENSDGEYQILKHSYDVPLFNESNTYPGVFSQNQILTVKDYSMSNDPKAVNAELAKFQLAEGIEINGITTELVPGRYDLTSTVTPTFTIDKSATYALKEAVDGVTVAADGALTIADTAIGSEFTVVATAVSDTDVTTEKTFTVKAKPQSESQLFDTGMVLTVKAPDGNRARRVNYEDSGNDVTVTASMGESGDAYIPLNANADKWYLTATIQNRSAGSAAVNNTEIGLMSATGGYMNYAKLGIKYSFAQRNAMTFEQLNGTTFEFADSVNGGQYASGALSVNTIGLIKDGSTYYIEINGKFSKKLTASFDGATTPVLYSYGTGVYFTNVELVTDGDAIDEYIASKQFYVGSYVDVVGNAYTLKALDLGAPYGDKELSDTLDWPPDNDYINGIKSAKAFTGNFSIEFTMSDIAPLNLSGIYDAKVLIYLKSERVTSSLQFVIKRTNSASPVTVQFTPNLDDATWTTYDLPSGVDILGGATKVKIVRGSDRVEMYLNDVRVYEDSDFMQNTGYWDGTTVATPGIGSFLCGVTITDPVFTAL